MGYAKSASLALAFGSTGSERSKECMALKYYCRLPFKVRLGFANVILSKRSVMFVSKVNRGPLSRSVCFPQSGSAATVSIATFMARRYRVTIPAHFLFFPRCAFNQIYKPELSASKRTASVERKWSLWFHSPRMFLCELVWSLGSATHSVEPLNKIANAL